MAVFQSYWTKSREDELRRLWGENLSQQEIAAALSGISWKAVGNKAKRMGLPPRAPVRREYAPPPAKKSHPRISARTELVIGTKGPGGAPKPIPVNMAEAQTGGKPWLTYRYKRDCAWPLWAAGEKSPYRMMVCGCPATAGVYCAEHASVADGRGKVKPPEAIRFNFQEAAA